MNLIGTNSNKKKTIMEKYNSTSHFYDERYFNIQFEKYESIMQNNDFKGKTIFDGGCGTGLLLDFMVSNFSKDLFQNFKLVGVDISIKMLGEFKNKIDKNFSIFKKNIHLILSDLDNLPFRDKKFDYNFLFTSLQNLPDISSGLSESLRIIKQNGEYFFSVLKKNLNLDEFHLEINKYFHNLKVIENEKLEDIIIQGKPIN